MPADKTYAAGRARFAPLESTLNTEYHRTALLHCKWTHSIALALLSCTLLHWCDGVHIVRHKLSWVHIASEYLHNSMFPDRELNGILHLVSWQHFQQKGVWQMRRDVAEKSREMFQHKHLFSRVDLHGCKC